MGFHERETLNQRGGQTHARQGDARIQRLHVDRESPWQAILLIIPFFSSTIFAPLVTGPSLNLGLSLSLGFRCFGFGFRFAPFILSGISRTMRSTNHHHIFHLFFKALKISQILLKRNNVEMF